MGWVCVTRDAAWSFSDLVEDGIPKPLRVSPKSRPHEVLCSSRDLCYSTQKESTNLRRNVGVCRLTTCKKG